ncbi:hypothetical protein NODU109028_19310 [Nocardioides dubius]|uniref:Lipoprotein n=1 Tax=Nocardioides dubius TaxID=317019 RepID=A0ABP4E4F1_9ACTN
MDLLSKRLRLATAAALLVLTACGTTSGSTSVDVDPLAPPTPEPVRPDESVLDRAEGAGTASEVASGRSDDLVIVYATCTAESATEVVLRTTLPRDEPMTVPCDGIVSRTQIFTVPGREFTLGVEAAEEIRWQVLVTARDE